MGQDVAAAAAEQKDRGAEGEQLELFKKYLAEPRFRIKLDDLVNATVREASRRTAADKFPPDAQVRTGEDVLAVLKAYEDAIRPAQAVAALLGKWATAEQRPTLANMVARLSDPCAKGYGWNAQCSAFQWYPISLVMYSAGIAALSAENHAAFAAVHAQKIDSKTKRIGSTAVPILVPAVDAMLDLAQANVWTCIPRQTGRNTPESIYKFKALKPALDDLLFLGSSYDPLFDRYEILRTWMYADFTEAEWAPVGRYAEQQGGLRSKGNPYHELRAEAEAQRDQWWPIKAGLFRGSYARFEQSVAKIEKVFLSGLNGFG
jgi:hypothetical protein